MCYLVCRTFVNKVVVYIIFNYIVLVKVFNFNNLKLLSYVCGVTLEFWLNYGGRL